MTDGEGRYLLTLNTKGEGIMFSYLGYEPVTIPLSEVKNETLNIKLKTVSNALEEVTITAKRKRYRNRDNPAVELIKKAIENKDKNRIETHDTYEYERYEKIMLAINDLNDSVKNGLLFRKFPFLGNYLDTSKQTGRILLPAYLRENISKHYFQKHPKSEKEFLLASQMANFNDFIEPEAISVYMDGMVGKSNIYDNQIRVLENDYMSPMSLIAPTFYHYHILDTVDVSGVSCVWLSVYPRNDQDFGFRGSLWITNDENYAVKRVELAFTQNHSANFVNEFLLTQEYTLLDSTWCLALDEVTIDFGLNKKKSQILGKRSNSYEKYRFGHSIPEEEFSGIHRVETVAGYDTHPEEFWTDNRHQPLDKQEHGVYDMIAEMKDDKILSHALNLSGMIYSGFIHWGKFDPGPVETFVSFNDIEGLRLRLGGKTNARFHPHLFFEGFAAYGTKDECFKYQVGVIYSFLKCKLHHYEHPRNLLSVSYEDNIETPGQFFLYGSADRLFSSFHRGSSHQMVYYRTLSVKYEREYLSGFSWTPSFSRRIENPTGNLIYTDANGNNVPQIITTQVGLRLRFAPNERFYQVQCIRYTLNHTNPIFTLDYNYGMKGVWGGDYEFHRLDASIEKRTWFLSYGFSDMQLKAGNIWGDLPFPLLFIHRANQSYAYEDDAFNMMNYMEFIGNQYVQFNFSYCFNGRILNKFPLIRKLKWREFVTFKSLWGDTSGEEIFRFPLNDENVPVMYRLNREPYMEAGVAIDNIFKILRIDLVKRINYLDHPDVSEWSVRFKLRFVF
jgi:hypothetical protein